jgi:RNA polymerase sigma-70 factor (ECF subfamily)
MAAVERRDDASLVAAAQAGDRAALDALLRRHYDRVHAVCRRIAGSSRDADDAAQEAMISIVRALDRFDGRAAFSTWIYRIATNAALDELRRRHRRPALHAVRDDDSTPEIADPDAERRYDSVGDRQAIDAALEGLPEDFRAAVVLRDVADLDYAEIAEVLQIPVGTVKSRIARGRGQLADALGNQDPTGRRPTTDPRDPAP